MKIEQKIRAFGHFLFCKVRCGADTMIMQGVDASTETVSGVDINDPVSQITFPIDKCKLLLKKLDQLTKKEGAECARLANLPSSLYSNWDIVVNEFGVPQFTWPDDVGNYRHKVVFKESCLNSEQIDYLRNQGFAIGVSDQFYEIETEIIQL